MKMDINNMSLKDFKNLPYKKDNKIIGKFDAIVILPTRKKHDSGYGCMEFVIVKNNIPLFRISGISDVIHIDGIGGMKNIGFPAWSMDLLFKSKLIRLWNSKGNLFCNEIPLSSFEVYSSSINQIK